MISVNTYTLVINKCSIDWALTNTKCRLSWCSSSLIKSSRALTIIWWINSRVSRATNLCISSCSLRVVRWASTSENKWVWESFDISIITFTGFCAIYTSTSNKSTFQSIATCLGNTSPYFSNRVSDFNVKSSS